MLYLVCDFISFIPALGTAAFGIPLINYHAGDVHNGASTQVDGVVPLAFLPIRPMVPTDPGYAA